MTNANQQVDVFSDVFEFLRFCDSKRKTDFPGLRKGQLRMNLLFAVRPDLYEKVDRTVLDVFYSDEQLTNFDAFLMENW